MCVHRQRAQRADDVDAEVGKEATVFGGEHRFDEMVGKFLERNRVVVLDAATTDLDAVPIQKGHREILALEPILVAGFPIGRQRERDGENQADQTDVQALADEIVDDLCESRQAQLLGKRRDGLAGPNRSALGVEHRGIDEGVKSQQGARDRLPEARLLPILRHRPSLRSALSGPTDSLVITF